MKDAWHAFLAALPVTRPYLLLLAVIAGFMVAERLLPAERNQPIRNRILTGEFTLLYLLVTPLVIVLPVYLAAKITSATGGSLLTINLDQVRTGSPPLDGVLHYILLPVLPFVVFDFFYYWHHRLQHTLPALWEQHKLHHMDESLYCLSSGRHHWLEEAIRGFTITIPMTFLIALGAVQGAMIVFVIGQWAIFIHANVRLPLGPFTPVLTGPQLHRIHHSREIRHADKNFAAFLPLWDILFGTYCRPLPGEWPATGLTNRERVSDFWAGVALPFHAWVPAMLAHSRRAGSALLRSRRD